MYITTIVVLNGHCTIGISPSDVRAFEDALIARHELLRPGFTRISFSFATTSKYVITPPSLISTKKKIDICIIFF